jgi:phosphoheptose isomerase
MTTNAFHDLEQVLKRCRDSFAIKIDAIGKDLSNTLKRGNKLLICGNGGSAAQAQHFSAELLNQYCRPRHGLAAIALTTDTSTITAIGNDYHFDSIFSKPFLALVRPDDVLICITTSGNSGNILKVIKCANDYGNKVILLTGNGGNAETEGGDAAALVSPSRAFVVPSQSTPRIQEVHNVIIHGLCEAIDRDYFGVVDP